MQDFVALPWLQHRLAPALRTLPIQDFRLGVDVSHMGIDVRLETEDGDEIETLLDFENSLREILIESDTARSVTLRFIDPYGNTRFNRLQIPPLIAELKEAAGRLKDGTARKFANAVLRLAERCQDEVNTYLQFYGS